MNNSTASSAHIQSECRRLKQQVERDGGTRNLHTTDLAFLESFCHFDDDPLPPVPDPGLRADSGIDESAHIREGTSFGDPNAGRPDDPNDPHVANQPAPDPPRTRR